MRKTWPLQLKKLTQATLTVIIRLGFCFVLLFCFEKGPQRVSCLVWNSICKLCWPQRNPPSLWLPVAGMKGISHCLRVSIALIKYHNQKQLGKKKVYFKYSFTPQSITKDSQGRNSKRAGNWQQELMQRQKKNAVYWVTWSSQLAQPAFL